MRDHVDRLADPERRHEPALVFSSSFGHWLNPYNWFAKYKPACGHTADSPGCLDYFPCCQSYDASSGCKAQSKFVSQNQSYSKLYL